MRIITFLLVLLLPALCVGEASRKSEAITNSERNEIEVAVRKLIDEKIIGIQRKSEDTVKVRTGVFRPTGNLEGKGQIFWLKRTNKGWELVKKGHWVT